MSEAAKAETEDAMAASQAMAVRGKRELTTKEEKTTPGHFYVPYTDIYETGEALVLVMEVPGVEREKVDVALENDVLRVEAKIDFSKYHGLEPLYTEYNIGHYARSFSLSEQIDKGAIKAELEGGILTITLPKSAQSRPRRIAVK